MAQPERGPPSCRSDGQTTLAVASPAAWHYWPLSKRPWAGLTDDPDGHQDSHRQQWPSQPDRICPKLNAARGRPSDHIDHALAPHPTRGLSLADVSMVLPFWDCRAERIRAVSICAQVVGFGLTVVGHRLFLLRAFTSALLLLRQSTPLSHVLSTEVARPRSYSAAGRLIVPLPPQVQPVHSTSPSRSRSPMLCLLPG